MRSYLLPIIGCGLLVTGFQTRSVASTPAVQSPLQASTSKKEDVMTVEETVNARFISETDRKIPFTVNHLNNADLEQRQIQDEQSMLWLTPGIALDTDGQNPDYSIKIRGVGAINQVSNDDTSVVTVLNGVPIPQGNLTNSLLDINEVDILKGPQGTLFGRNSEAGVINITSNRPTDIFEGHIGGKWGTHQHYLGEMVMNTPFSDTLSSRLALQYEQKDAVLKNQLDGNKPVSRPQNFTGRASFGWTPDEQDELFLTIDQLNQKHIAMGFKLLDGSDKTAIPKGSMDGKENDTTLTFNWQHNWEQLKFTNVTGWGNYYHSSAGPNMDSITSQYLFGTDYNSWRMFSNKQKQFFQEFRLGSTEGSSLFWVMGMNYIHSARTQRYNGGWNEMPGWEEDPNNAQTKRLFNNDSFALFGETTLPITEKLDLTTGIRHTWENIRYQSHWVSNTTSMSNNDKQSLYETYFTGRIGLNYALTDDWNIYAIYSHGHKSGGFSDWDTSIASGQPATPYKEASVDSYEIGNKALLTKNIELKQALFFNKTRDDHYYALIDPSLSFATVTESFDTESKGAEMSATWHPNNNLMLQMGMDYTLATITKLPSDSQSGGHKGNLIPNVPRWGASFTTDYSKPTHLADLPVIFNTSLNYRYSSQSEVDVGNNFKLGETHLLNARMGFKSSWGDIYLWSTNLLNNRSSIYGFYYPAIPVEFGGTGNAAHVGSIREGRVVGISYQYYF